MVSNFVAAVLLALSVVAPSYAAPALQTDTTTTSDGVLLVDHQVCRTKYVAGTASASSSLASSTSTQVHSATKTIVGTVPISEETVLVTPEAVIRVDWVDPTTAPSGGSPGSGSSAFQTTNATVSTVTVTSWVNSTRTFVTDYTSTVEVCTATVTANAGDGVSTVYTGQYNKTVAKRTASPMAMGVSGRSSDLLPRGSALTGFAHFRGDDSWRDDHVAAEVNCVVHVTAEVSENVLTTGAVKTTTLTAATPTTTVTSTVYQDSPSDPSAGSSVPPRTIIVTSTTTTQIRTGAVYTSSVECTTTPDSASGSTNGPSSTTTQHIACAPTNLIDSANGFSIEAVRAGGNVTAHLSYASSSSDCCQQCHDEASCAASEMDPAAGNCFLYLVNEADGGHCGGLAFEYSDEGKGEPAGSGLVVQASCGTIRAKVSLSSNVMRIFQA
ncbi:hypothetical protein K431DRAFT_93088 [Polychaeton citri CBS 116435]|uniref:Apple domain-containing protein n=1 Tax=Polychaeton citri CBS 116435 TaxID=1314669 RepID=A0A9P4Q8H0_9PEZI|nr:hypothetical protein K431DRAFT_93088 [Polychaeton citri CBS 116435]